MLAHAQAVDTRPSPFSREGPGYEATHELNANLQPLRIESHQYTKGSLTAFNIEADKQGKWQERMPIIILWEVQMKTPVLSSMYFGQV